MTTAARTRPLLASVSSVLAGKRRCEPFRPANPLRASLLGEEGAGEEVGPAASVGKDGGTSYPLDLPRRAPPGRADVEAAPLG